MGVFMVDKEILAALAKQAAGFQERVPIFHIRQPSAAESVGQAQALARSIWTHFTECGLRPDETGSFQARMRLPHNGRVDVFYPSGAISASMSPSGTPKPLTPDERSADRKALQGVAEQVAMVMAKSHVGPNEQLRFESLWEKKGQGTTLRGEKSPVALFEVLASYRRYLHGLPVLGRASVHVALGAGSQVTRWGIDWRRIREQPFAHAAILSPEEGAKRILEDLWWRRPERPFTLKDFQVKSFTLGYMSLSRRVQQFVMQPVWVAVLAPQMGMSMGHVVAVPATPEAFEPISRPATTMPVARP
jgi:hypothetical protein